MKRNGTLKIGLLSVLLTVSLLLLSSCQLIPSLGGTESETESETEAETVPTFAGKNTLFVLFERAEAGALASVRITGDVCLAGMTGSLKLPAGVTVDSLTAGDGVSVALEGDEIRFVFLSQNCENVTAECVLFTFILDQWRTQSPAVTVTEAFDAEFMDAEYTVEFYAFGK